MCGIGYPLLLLLLLVNVPAVAHEPYTDWHNPVTGGSCCNDTDCRPVSVRQDDKGQWEAWDGWRWLKVPPLTVLNIPSPDGRSHLCEARGVVHCFVLAPDMY